jgi:hypothetical protein
VTLWRNRALYGMARTESNANDTGRPPFPIPEQQSAACITSVAASLPEPEQDDFRHHCRRAWARLIRKVWSADPLVCPKSSGPLRIISFIENPPSHLPGGIIPDDFHANRCYSAPSRKKRTTIFHMPPANRYILPGHPCHLTHRWGQRKGFAHR